MNTPATPQDFELQLGRLVDGELTGDAYRAFLGSLDEAPQGWRRCALAFLEEQALRRELGQELAEPVVAPAAAVETSHQSRFPWLALAAAVLVAFALGVVLRGGWQTGPAADPLDQIAALPETETPPQTDPTPQLAESNPPAAQELVQEPVQEQAAPSAADDDPALTVVVGEGEREQSFRLPVSEVDQLEEDWYDQQQWAFTSQAQQDLAAQGYQGSSRQSFVPIDLGDGRQMILPVEEVMIQPVAYQ